MTTGPPISAGTTGALFFSSGIPWSNRRFKIPAISRMSRKLMPAKRIPANAPTSNAARKMLLIAARPSLMIPAAMMPSTAGLST